MSIGPGASAAHVTISHGSLRCTGSEPPWRTALLPTPKIRFARRRLTTAQSLPVAALLAPTRWRPQSRRSMRRFAQTSTSITFARPVSAPQSFVIGGPGNGDTRCSALREAWRSIGRLEEMNQTENKSWHQADLKTRFLGPGE